MTMVGTAMLTAFLMAQAVPKTNAQETKKTASRALQASAMQARHFIGVSDRQRAEFNWVMHCRGCHGRDAQGSQGGAPNMAGEVAQFLYSKAGRDYLVRVPGVAFVALPDDQVAELVNWLVQEFDQSHLPDNFEPYDKVEVNRLRNTPLISEASVARSTILREIKPEPPVADESQ